MENKTYEIYGSVLKGTPFYGTVNENAYIPYSENFSVLGKEIAIGGITCSNRIEYQPMEGQDALLDGSPSDKTFERYIKLAKGGAGLIWVEAVSVCEEGKSNPYQLCITESNLDLFKKLVSTIKTECYKANGFEPVVIIQLNHSGRYSKPMGVPAPVTAYFNPDIEDAPKRIITDDELRSLSELFSKSSRLSILAGFDGIDIKACHGYLASELLSAFDREGLYGGSFENRSRLFREMVEAAHTEIPQKKILAARINIFDGFEGKYSFGKPDSKDALYDLSEAKKLAEILAKNGGALLNVTMGSPYRNPDVSRPYRSGIDKPKSDAVFALSRLWKGASDIKACFPQLKIVNTGISLLGALSPFAAAGAIEENMTDFVGFGRMSFAYPSLARDILNGSFDNAKVCVACSGCSTLKKNVLPSGCIIRDDYYKQIFRDWKRGNSDE
ncbi:MAG: flavin oxidoreductase/NADH oxidase [Clostridia bacterium]|nr:flavin oxidoreductase/NADH oxidase [Clostridia bacterium]